jgi:hypothetical protein
MVDVETRPQACAMRGVVYLRAQRGCIAALRQRGARSTNVHVPCSDGLGVAERGDERVSTLAGEMQ